ncbi:XRE family transcriptional regulator [Fructilactobacillus myrtifloralis]|uniref:XRE family transcriptional regulator n=1 Tax=Fructilactobacillus myrtifloralis TaxID=2940301 RepID=A0ABY5BLR3_9LACO|nr:XRE family transcriptional regulator [Fructilactobacillus myrtifloralis]USS84614.1 XRE family transcriptional regulator [Fructilactobacillus myrtifloralis]
MREFNGKRLNEARFYNSLSITKLASELGISKQMVSKYENSNAQPSSDVLFNIIKILGFPADFYFDVDKFSHEEMGTFYRSSLNVPKKLRSPASTLINAISIYRNYLETYLDFPDLPLINKADLNDISGYNYEQIAMDLRSVLGLKNQPIQDMGKLLESRGFIASFIPKENNKIDAFSQYKTINNSSYFIIFIKNSSFFRNQFSLAHELSHWYLHGNYYLSSDNYTKDEKREIENQANNLAASFLLPREPFINDFRNLKNDSINNLLTLKLKWKVSLSSIVTRIYNLKLISYNRYLSLEKQISARKFRKKEPYDDMYKMNFSSLQEGTKLLVDNGIIRYQEIPDAISKNYGINYGSRLLSEVTGVKEDLFVNSNPITLKKNIKKQKSKFI